MVWVGLSCFGLVWVGLAVLGRFEPLWIVSRPDHSVPSAQAPRPTAPHSAPPRRARRPLASAAFRPPTLLVIGQIFSQSFTFRRSDWLRRGGGARLSPAGVGGVRVRALGALFRAAFPVAFPAASPAAMELFCQALRTTHQAREAVRTGGAGGSASGLRVAVAMSTGAGGVLCACASALGLSWRQGRGWV